MDNSFSLSTHRTVFFDPRKDTIFPNFLTQRHFDAFLRRLLNGNDSPNQNVKLALAIHLLQRTCTHFMRQYTTPTTSQADDSLVVAPKGHSATYSLSIVINTRGQYRNASNQPDAGKGREIVRKVKLSENALNRKEEQMWSGYGYWLDDLLRRAGRQTLEKAYVFRHED
ncbi:MAG: hypothetical protein Q9160_004385 [Pyrenula sp. 1 TL-2023]